MKVGTHEETDPDGAEERMGIEEMSVLEEKREDATSMTSPTHNLQLSYPRQ